MNFSSVSDSNCDTSCDSDSSPKFESLLDYIYDEDVVSDLLTD